MSDSEFMPIVDFTGIDWSPSIAHTLDKNGVPAHGNGIFDYGTGMKYCCLSWLGIAGCQRWYVGDYLCCTLFCLTWGWFGIGSLCDLCFGLDSDVTVANNEIQFKLESKVMEKFGEIGGERVVCEYPQPSSWWWVAPEGYPDPNYTPGKRSTINYPTGKDLYTGDVNSKGEPHGRGIVVYGAGSNQYHKYLGTDGHMLLGMDGRGKYSGEWVDGKPEGKGMYTSTSGYVYYGEFVNGRPHGNGTLTNMYGKITYQGKWICGHGDYKGPVNAEGLPHGEGRSVDPQGRYFSGNCRNGDRYGKGRLDCWEGEFVNNELHGKVTNTYTGSTGRFDNGAYVVELVRYTF